MSKSYAQMANEILKGALTDSTKNPYDSAQGHQASMPAMDANDTLVEMSDGQRSLLMEAAGVEQTTKKEPPKKETPSEWGAPTLTMELTSQELETLSEAKRIITKIQEMTSVGSIGVNMAGGAKGDAKKVKLPGPDYKKPAPKKRAKKKAKPEVPTHDFLSYLKA